MNLPFTPEEFFTVFSIYNNTVFPVQFLFIIIAVLDIFILVKKFSKYYFFIPLSLAGFWLWIGLVYNFVFFLKINPAAKLFGLLFIIQAFLFLFVGFKRKFIFNNNSKLNKYFSYFLLTYSLVLYPIITILTGHSYPSMPTFGLPCPTTIFTFGVFLLTDLNKLPKYLFIIPIIWTLIGTMAASNLGVTADYMLILSSVLFLLLFVLRRKVTI